MTTALRFTTLCLIALLCGRWGLAEDRAPNASRRLVDFRDIEELRASGPLLIAHRGGVIGPNAPECSLNAIRNAAAHGYRMVELDVRVTTDGVPVVFHDDTLRTACGSGRTIQEMTAGEATATLYRASDQHIATLDEAFALCGKLNLGVMLDMPPDSAKPYTPEFFDDLGRKLDAHGLTHAAITFWGYPLAVQHLRGRMVFPVSGDELEAVKAGRSVDLRGKIAFHQPHVITAEMVPAVRRSGAFVIVPINTFLYPPHAHMELAHRDVERYQAAGTDGFQIDSAYEAFFSAGLRVQDAAPERATTAGLASSEHRL
jgi:glycerophosphoryl diester phosphodiesterase